MKTEMMKMLSTSANDIARVGGGWASLTPQDIAAALAGLPDGPYLLGMAAHVIDGGCRVLLITYIRGRYRVPPVGGTGLDPVEAIVDLCLDELWGDNMCGSCGGTKVTHEQQQCPICKGRGHKQQSDLSRAKKARIPVEQWGAYKGFYERLYTQFTDWGAQIGSHLARRLSSE